MPQFTPAQKEQIARQNGFRNYNEMILWQQQREKPSGGVVIKGQSRPLPGSAQQAQQQAMAWHPATIFNYISEKLKAATGN